MKNCNKWVVRGGTSGPPGVDKACKVEDSRVADSIDNCGIAGGGWPRKEAASSTSMRDRQSSWRDSFRADKSTCDKEKWLY